jgi:hypothetical protein
VTARDSDRLRETASRAEAEVSQPGDSGARLVTGSALLEELHDCAPSGHFTLEWLMSSLRKQSYPALIFLLGIIAVVPGLSLPAGVLLLIAILELIAGWPAPTFPRWIATRPLPTDKLRVSLKRAIPILKAIETAIHPRWPMALAAPRWIIGVLMLWLTVRLLASPLPLSNMLPAALIGLIALAYLEHDGVMFALAVAAGLVVLVLEAKVFYDLAQEIVNRIAIQPDPAALHLTG